MSKQKTDSHIFYNRVRFRLIDDLLWAQQTITKSQLVQLLQEYLDAIKKESGSDINHDTFSKFTHKD